jgi:hypothetical protein
MQVQLERHVEERSKCEPWDRVVTDAGPCDHIVQLGQATIFAALCRFAGVARERRVRRSGANVHPLKRHLPINALFGIALQCASVRWRSPPSRGIYANRPLRPAQLGVEARLISRITRHRWEERP